MLIHLGGGFSADSRAVVLMADISSGLTADTSQVVAGAKAQGRLVKLPGVGSTLVLLEQQGLVRCVITPVNLRTLRGRAAEPVVPRQPMNG